MITQPDEAEKSVISGSLQPPRWLSRAEKSDFRRLVNARHAAGMPVLATERDALADFCNLRARITVLRRLASLAMKKCLVRDDYGRQVCQQSDQRHAALMNRNLDNATALSRRLARDLKLSEGT